MNARLRFLADEDFDNNIVRGLLRRLPTLDVVRAQDVGLSGQRDPQDYTTQIGQMPSGQLVDEKSQTEEDLKQ